MPASSGAGEWEGWLRPERDRLLRFCVGLTGDPHVAEDLVQDTLCEAWRLRARGRAVQPTGQWLMAIARHVCLRWRRSRARELARWTPLPGESGVPDAGPAGPCDIEAELERSELVELLDRALAELPARTRSVLIERFVHGSAHAEIARRLGLSEGAVTMRVQRGKLRLRRLLTTRFRDQAAAFGLADALPPEAEWQQTRIWCPQCGARRLWGRWAGERQLCLECWGCGGRPRVTLMQGFVGEYYGGQTCAELLAGVSGFKPAANRLLAATHEVYRHGIAGLTARCARCGRCAPVRVSAWGDVRLYCSHCGMDNGISATGGVAFSHPAAQAFWRRHARIRALPDRHVEAGGCRAVVCGTESLTDGSRLDLVLVRDTLVVLGVHGASPSGA